MAYYECSSKKEPESIIITLVPDTNVQKSSLGHLNNIHFYIDDTLIATYSHNGNYFWNDKTYIYTSPKSNKSVTINIIVYIVNLDGYGYPTSIQLAINGNVVSTLGEDGYYFLRNAIVYKYTFS